MAADFGLGGYDKDQLGEIFDLLRDLRLTAGDFIPEIPGSPRLLQSASKAADT